MTSSLKKPDDLVQLYRRQFLISTSPVPPVERFKTHELGESFFLHRCPQLPMLAVGKDLVVGRVASDETPTHEIRPAGRWVAVGRRIFTDSAGLLGVFYSSTNGGSVALSSSPGLLRAHLSAERISGLELRGARPNWWLSPGTPFEGVRRLFPDEALELVDGEIVKSRIRHPLDERRQFIDNDHRAQVLIDELAGSIRALAAHGRLRIALTAGYDSRTILAAAIHAGVSFDTYTQGLSDDTTDVQVAKDLSQIVGCEHHLISVSALSRRSVRQRLAVFDSHTSGSSRDADRGFIAAGFFDQFDGQDILLRGGCFELGGAHYDNFFGANDLSQAVATVQSTVRHRFRVPPVTFAEMRPWLSLWLEHRSDREYCLDRRDSFYLDQRLGAWLSATELGLDLVRPTSIHPANSGRILQALAGEGPESRGSGREVQEMAIALAAPELLAPPFNPQRRPSALNQLGDRLGKVCDLVSGEVASVMRRRSIRSSSTSDI